MSAERVAESWNRYQHWLRQHLPSFLDELQPPASNASLRALEETIGRSLPSDVVELWKHNNGQRSEQPGVLAGFQFLPVEAALAEWHTWAKLRASYTPRQLKDMGALASSLPRGAIQRAYTCEGWIPLWKEPLEANYLGVDLSPGERGTPGQVINFGRDEDDKAVLADAFAEVLEQLAIEAEMGHLVVREYEYRHGECRTYLEHTEGRFLSFLLRKARKQLTTGG